MGIEVPDFVFDSTGVTLPMAYIALARNSLSLAPQGPWEYRLLTRYNVWSSFEAREAGKYPVDERVLEFVTPPQTQSLVDVYQLAYEELKRMYPTYIDKQDPPDPTPDTQQPDPTPDAQPDTQQPDQTPDAQPDTQQPDPTPDPTQDTQQPDPPAE